METIIQASGLTKHFGKFKAVENVSLNIAKGEIYGFIGLNGAGKTTAMRMMLGMVRPTKGQVLIKGRKINAGSHEAWKNVGYMIETPHAYPELTVKENLEIMANYRKITEKQAVGQIMEKLLLTPYADRKTKNLSLGNAQRLGLAKALIHKPEILILDEPANGLDPAGMFQIRELLTDMAQNHGVTMIISSHILGEIAKFASRIGIIHQGTMVDEKSTDALAQKLEKRLIIETRNREAAKAILMQKGLLAHDAYPNLLTLNDAWPIENPDEIAKILVGAQAPPLTLKVEKEDLEAYFFKTIGISNQNV
jgi:ABC-2 type transport system ATP-binding protein